MKKNIRNVLSAALVLALLAVLLIVPAMAEEAVITTAEQLKSAVAKGGEITLGGDIDVGTAIEVSTEVVLDLNGKTLTCPNDTAGDGVFHVVSGGKLTINGEGTINSVGKNNYSMAIWADGGEVIINGGTYTNKGCKVEGDPDNNHYDLIYVKNGGSVSIYGGTFECEIPKWTLNSHDNLTGTFKVHGGTFIGFDPTNADTEPGGLKNWVVPGSTCKAVGDTYTVTGAAAIGNAQYATLQDALNAANAGDTVALLRDVQLESGLTVAAGREVVLELNGFVLSGVSSTSGASALITNNGTLTINDSSAEKTGKITTQAENPDTQWTAGYPAYANNTITNCGTLTINGGRIENVTGEGFCIPIDNNSTNRDAILVVNGGEIVHPNGNVAVRQYANSDTHQNSVTVNDGLLEGVRAVWIHLPSSDTTKAMPAELTVNGGTLRSTDKGEDGYNLAVYSYTYGNSFAKTKLTIQGGTFDGDVALTGGSNKTAVETVSVTGGTFLGEYGVYSYGEVTEGFISGGTFACDPSAYLTGNASVDSSVSGQWTVHVWSAFKTYDNDAHWYYCENEGCDAKKDVAGHTFVEKEDFGYVVSGSDCSYTFLKSCECGHASEEIFVVTKENAVHDYSETGVVTKDPTCTDTGVMSYFCKYEGCNAAKTEDIEALGHKDVHVEGKDKTCTEDGVREHWYCEVCSNLYKDEELTGLLQPEDVVIPAGHRFAPVAAKPATCTEAGNIEYYLCNCGHMAVADGETLKEVTLKDVTIPAGHNYTSRVDAKEATCTENGNVEYWACEHCDVVEIVTENGRVESTQDKTVIVAKGHTMTKVETKTPTCTGDGNVEYYNCSVCDKNYADEKGEKELTTVVEAAKGHKLTKVEAKAATYTEAGNIEHYACDCGTLFADAEGKKEITDVVIPQLIKVEEEKAEVSKGAVDNAIADAKEKAEETGKPVEVVIEVPKAPVVEKPEDGETSDTPVEKPEEKLQEVVKVELPVQALENVAKEEATLTVVMPSVTVTVDTDALKSVTEQAAGNTVTLVVEQVEKETLTEKQQEVVEKYDVAVTIKAEFICQETQDKIWTENNNAEKESGSVTVKMPFTPAEGTKGTDYTVLYIADDGTVKEIETAFEDGQLVFTLEHFSEYVVVNTKTADTVPETGDAVLAPFVALLAMSAVGAAVVVAEKKNRIG